MSALCDGERAALSELSTATECEAFRLLHAFAQHAEHTGEDEFPASLESLGERLDMSVPGVSKLLARFRERGIIERTRAHVPNKWAARYRWTAGIERPF